MRIPGLRWAFIALAAVVLGYTLNRGIFVGSAIKPYPTPDMMFYAKYCRYLHWSGIPEEIAFIEMNRSAIDNAEHHCPPLR